MTCRTGSRIGLPDMLPFNLRKAITEPEKVIAPIATPSPISTRLTGNDRAVAVDDAERGRIEEGRRADQHRRHADEAVESRDQLRHRGHRDPPGGDETDAAPIAIAARICIVGRSKMNRSGSTVVRMDVDAAW